MKKKKKFFRKKTQNPNTSHDIDRMIECQIFLGAQKQENLIHFQKKSTEANFTITKRLELEKNMKSAVVIA